MVIQKKRSESRGVRSVVARARSERKGKGAFSKESLSLQQQAIIAVSYRFSGSSHLD
jgi:hypothetical protein